jgi:hypothetical protein
MSSIAFMLAGVPRAACVLILSIETELTTTAEQSGSIVFDTLYSARRRICFGGGAEKFSGGGIENSAAAAPKISTGGGGGIRRRRALPPTRATCLSGYVDRESRLDPARTRTSKASRGADSSGVPTRLGTRNV